jgi:HCOMODA/2-hydroxy-3-carboxy-muconic semialdehyde decarboxylase
MIRYVLLIGAMTLASLSPTFAQPTGNEPPDTNEQRMADLVLASRILVNEGVLDSFGHVSVRSKTNPNRFFMPRAMPPGLVTLKDLIELDLDAVQINPNGPRPNGEKFIHSEIYKAKPEVQAVVHSHSPAVIPFSMNPDRPMRPVLHTSVFLPERVKVFEIRELAKSDPSITGKLMVNTMSIGAALARQMGSDSAILLRSHGNVVVGSSLPMAVLIAVYMQANARTQMEAHIIGQNPIYLSKEEIELNRKELFPERPWENFKSRLPKQ